MRSHGEVYTDWIDKIDGGRQMWALAYDGGFRCGHMTTNLVECYNGVFLGIRHMPISALLEATHFRMVKLFHTKSVAELKRKQQQKLFSEHLETVMPVIEAAAGQFEVQPHDQFNNIFEVKNKRTNSRYIVSMYDRMCECGDFQNEKYPCQHAVACCKYGGVNWGLYVDQVYTTEELIKLYGTRFLPIGHRDNWPVFNGPRIEPKPESLRDGKGRPVANRFPNTMDYAQNRRGRKCGNCRQYGHRRDTCPNLQ
jgi:zinc finger SWIM domain-containing protein 3